MQSTSNAIVPQPRCTLSIRLAEPRDLPFLDALQKMHTHMVGFFPRKQMEGYLNQNAVLVADDAQGSPLGYCAFKDSYSGRDDVGMIYQINVMPLKHRNLIGAMLVKAAFDRAAYGVKLFSCWCAQDIPANWFWESLGFVPLAFRTGTRTKQRTHIFWQKRIREGDTSTPWWFPSQTKSGAFREDRLAFPIPPGVHWRDPMPIVLPEVQQPRPGIPDTLPGGQPVRARPQQPKLTRAEKAVIQRSTNKHLQGVPLGKVAVITARGFKYVDRPGFVPELDTPEELAALAKLKRKPATRAPAPKHDPKHIALARELRDRFLDQVNGDPSLLLPNAKYEVAKALPAPQGAPVEFIEVKALPAAA